MKDHLVKATVEGVRIFSAVTTNLVNEVVKRHDCYPVAAAALGRTMTGALLFAANLKNDEAITIKIQGDGPLGKIVADAVPEGFTRGYVDNPHVDLPLNSKGKIDVAGGVGRNGLVSVTRFTGLKKNIVGSAEIVSGEIAEDLTNYLYVSEQTPSSIGLGVLVDTDLTIKAAGGFFVQPLPNVSEDTLNRLESNLCAVNSVTDFVASGLDAKEIIKKIFDGFDINFSTTTDLQFRCHCSREKIEGVLMSLGRDDLQSLIDDGHAEVNCQFCGKKYQFTSEELKSLQKNFFTPKH
ncbi:MAG: Hsp33 family molecular chaperone HslO [Selenomonadaceae bacterium]|nr:Hsp33 family molecular chaperone HslO [Selenomonadaceae bacterium]